MLSVQQCVCSVQQLNVTQSECATFAQLDYTAVLLTAGGDDCQFCVWDVRTFDCGPHTKDKRWDSIPAIASMVCGMPGRGCQLPCVQDVRKHVSRAERLISNAYSTHTRSTLRCVASAVFVALCLLYVCRTHQMGVCSIQSHPLLQHTLYTGRYCNCVGMYLCTLSCALNGCTCPSYW